MWTSEDFPTGPIPWPLLIRARYVHELDAVIGSTIGHALYRVASGDFSIKFTEAAFEAVRGAEFEKTDPERTLGVATALADFDDWCGTWWPHRWPGPGPRPPWWDQLNDPTIVIVVNRAQELINTVGSRRLQGAVGPVLGEIAQFG